ncbi:hypothetical protein H4O20_07920 [Aequorivita sp. 609]|uniref:hypothetical protein n=1 Tax=Aequorivita TaxID=153265 RepID=UPI001613CCDA|nr:MULTISPECIES: hypothetical protein [Aequorivita]MBB6681366.1 hypothetical protein [Aequorivita sp. 609]
MKIKIIIVSLILISWVIKACTPTPIILEPKVEESLPVFGTGGEQGVDPDNDKD